MTGLLRNKAVLLSLLLLPGGFAMSHQTPDTLATCEGVQLKVEITNSGPSAKASVEAVVTGASAPIHYLFYNAKNQPLSKDITAKKVENVEPGTYFCSILDGKGCIKKTEFKIE